MALLKRATLMTLPLELIDHILTFLSWPNNLHPLLLVSNSLNPVAERILPQHRGTPGATRRAALALAR